MNKQNAKLIDELKSTIKSATKLKHGLGNGKWTATIKDAFIKLGKNKGYDVCASGFRDVCDREWLYDMVWFRNEPKEHLREIGLVLECEWDQSLFEIKYDFEKLLIAKSPIKVMIFQDNKQNLPQLWSLLETGILTFQTERANETYLLAAFRNDPYDFVFKTITA